MKKLFIIAFAVAVTGLASSCTKDNSVTPAKTTKTVVADKTDVGQGDYTDPSTPPATPGN